MSSTWIDGKLGNLIPANDRGLAYGDGVFETLKVASGRPLMGDLHWQRMGSGLDRLGIQLDHPLLLREVDSFLLTQEKSGVLKVAVTRGAGGRGYNPAGSGPARRVLSFHPLPIYSPDPGQEGVALFPCKTRLGYSMLAGLKHLNRLENVLARSEWQSNDFREGLMLDWEGGLIEGTMSNLFLVVNGALVTPLLDRCGVKGVCREFILQQADSWGLTFSERRVAMTDLEQAEEVFVCNSVNGVWPVTSYDGHHWKVGDVTRTVRDRILDVLNV